MFSNDSSKAGLVEVVIHVLTQALQELSEHDSATAWAMLAIAQMLEDLQLDFNRHFEVEGGLKWFLK